MTYKITDQRDLIQEAIYHGYRDTTDIDRYGFELKYWNPAFEEETCATRICFPTKEEAEKYIILNKLHGII